jgi:hypothetical protein
LKSSKYQDFIDEYSAIYRLKQKKRPKAIEEDGSIPGSDSDSDSVSIKKQNTGLKHWAISKDLIKRCKVERKNSLAEENCEIF